MVQLSNQYTYNPTTDKPIVPFKAEGWQIEAWRDKSEILLLTGSAGGGKSRLAAEKLHAICLQYPKATCVALRKNRSIMKNSTVVFFENSIIGQDPRVIHAKSNYRFEYKNGSKLVYAGMQDDDQREHFKSIGQDGGVDHIWCEEANALSIRDFNVARSRLRGKATPWNSIILTTNPDSPNHWIYTQLILGKMPAKILYSSAKDNKHNPARYTNILEGLTGIDKIRLCDGLWQIAEGTVFKHEWLDDYDSSLNPTGNVSEIADYDSSLEVYWGVDAGYTGSQDDSGNFTENSHPMVILLYHITPEGFIYVFDECYLIEHQPESVISCVLGENPVSNKGCQYFKQYSDYFARVKYPKPYQAIVDKSAAALKHRLYNDFNISYVGSSGLVEQGITELGSWLAPDQNGVRKLLVHPRCSYLRKEFASYSRDEKGRIKKAHDHGIDDLRYITWYNRQLRNQ